MIKNIFAANAICAIAAPTVVPGYPSALGTAVAGTRRRTRLIGTTLGIAPRT